MNVLPQLTEQLAELVAVLRAATPETMAAFLLGAVGWAMGARLAVVGIGLLLLAPLVPELQAETWVQPAILALAALAVAQVLLTLAVGEQSAGTVLVGFLVAVVVVVLWRGPMRAAALIPLMAKLWKG